MIQYYYTKLRLFFLYWCAIRNERKGRKLRAKISSLQTVISAGFTSEKEFTEFNKRLIDNHSHAKDPYREKELERLRNKHYNNFQQPKKRFKDSRDKHAQQEAQQRVDGFKRVIKERPLIKNPQDLKPDMPDTSSEQKGQ